MPRRRRTWPCSSTISSASVCTTCFFMSHRARRGRGRLRRSANGDAHHAATQGTWAQKRDAAGTRGLQRRLAPFVHPPWLPGQYARVVLVTQICRQGISTSTRYVEVVSVPAPPATTALIGCRFLPPSSRNAWY